MGAPPASVCASDATWNGRCSQHGGVVPTVPELMTLLSKLTGWGDQSLSVAIGYKRARVRTAQDESHLDDRTRGFTVGTTMAYTGGGQDRDIHAQGSTLEEALWVLCRGIVEQSSKTRVRAVAHATEADRVMDEFLQSRYVP